MSDDPFFEGEEPEEEVLPEPDSPGERRAERAREREAARERWAAEHLRGPVVPLVAVEVTHVREHPFQKREKRGCALCKAGKQRMVHVGVPPSVNVFGSGSNQFTYQAAKKNWQERLTELLDEAGLPRGLGSVYVEGVMGFPTRQRRDQGNYRFIIEKALGDALVLGAWLEDDDWRRYEFGRLQCAYEKGAQWTRLTVYPSWEDRPPLTAEPGQAALAI